MKEILQTSQRVLVCFLVLSMMNPLWAKTPVKTKAESKAVAGQGTQEEMPVTMFKVNGQEFTVREYAEFLQKNPQLISTAMNTDEGKIAAVREMVVSSLLLEAMQREGLLKKKPGETPEKELREAYEKLAEKHFPRPSIPDEKSAFKYYQDHQNDYGIPAMIRVRQILFRVPKNADEAVKKAAKERADAALKRLEAGEPFQELAPALTENPIGKLTEGDLGFITPVTPLVVQESVKGKQAGQYTGVLEGQEGYEILQVMDTRPSLIAPYANVRDKVIKQMMDKEQQNMRMAYVKELAKSAKIEIIEPSLRAIMPGGMFE